MTFISLQALKKQHLVKEFNLIISYTINKTEMDLSARGSIQLNVDATVMPNGNRFK